MYLIKKLILFTCVFLNIECFAQVNINSIKSDPKYYWGEGSGNSVDEASRDALSQISNKICVSVISATNESDKQEDNNGNISYSSKQEGYIKTSSFATLSNVEKLVLSPEPNARVFSYVLKTDVEKMFQEKEKKILDFIETGKKAEKMLQIDDALRYYYWALMLAKTNPKIVYCEFNGNKGNCISLLPLKIKAVLNNTKVTILDCDNSNNDIIVRLHFKYEDKDISSIQFSYYDGQSYVGPVAAKDGIGEIDLVSIPANNKISIIYETKFRKEAENIDIDLRSAFASTTAPIIDNATVEIPIKVNNKKQTISQVTRNAKENSSISKTDNINIKPEEIITKSRIDLATIKDSVEYLNIIKKVEEAIKTTSPESVYNYFSPDGYQMFKDLLLKTGKVSLSGKSSYSFIEANDQILARFCHVKIKFKNGQAFMENIVFRFDPNDKKIHSLAFALTKKAEDDIFNAAAQWSSISRYTILNFMEDYQTAYSLKRIDYLKQIFSDDAIIIVGSVLKPEQKTIESEHSTLLNNDKNIRYNKLTKEEYLKNLKNVFNSNDYVHLTFEENITKKININDNRISKDAAFGIQIKQTYNSNSYSDRGYLTLFLDLRGAYPTIRVRLWQPGKEVMVDFYDFLKKFDQ